MSLWDNNILMGKQVLYTILGNNVLNLQTQGFRPKKGHQCPPPPQQGWFLSFCCVCFHLTSPHCPQLSLLQLHRTFQFLGRAPHPHLVVRGH